MAFALVALISWIGLRSGQGTVAAAADRPAATTEKTEQAEKADATR